VNVLDTGRCVQESLVTLFIQQAELISGIRFVQMFPAGTFELLCPQGLRRFENERGVFHFWPEAIKSIQIERLSRQGRENLFLRLGPYSKTDITERLENGEQVVFITEYTMGWTEVRSAVGTTKTVEEQLSFFNKTKSPSNQIMVGIPPHRVILHLLKGLSHGLLPQHTGPSEGTDNA
jgi:hypothetical protein